MRRPAAVADLLGKLLRGTPAEQRLKEGRIWLVWENAVGRRIASHAQPAAFRDGILTLRVDSAPWMQQLNFLKRELIAKVNAELGEELVKELYMKGGKVAPLVEDTPKVAKRRELTEQEREWIAEQTATVTDPELKAVFESLMKKDRENRD
jgi:predicted nucleic acid-binding Zn ribbon protein